MLVSELIHTLSLCPPDTEIWLDVDDDSDYVGLEPQDIKILRDQAEGDTPAVIIVFPLQ